MRSMCCWFFFQSQLDCLPPLPTWNVFQSLFAYVHSLRCSTPSHTVVLLQNMRNSSPAWFICTTCLFFSVQRMPSGLHEPLLCIIMHPLPRRNHHIPNTVHALLAVSSGYERFHQNPSP